MNKNKENIVIELNKAGKSSKDIAIQINVSGAYVCKILKKNGLTANVPPKFGTYEIDCAICGNKFIPKSRSATTCSSDCKKELLSKKATNYAISTGAKNVITPEKEPIILTMRAAGHSISDIGKKIGLEDKAIRQWIARNTDMSSLKGNEKYSKRMDNIEKDKAISLSKQGVYVKTIAKELGFSITSTKNFLIKQEQNLNIPTSTPEYGKRMDNQTIEKIMQMHGIGKNVTDISNEIDFSPTAVRSFLRNRKIKPNIVIVDISRPCVICNESFKPKYSDGKDKNIYKTCSVDCLSKLISKNKTKYTQHDIDNVINMAKNGYSNETIAKETGVKISKVKEIISFNELYRIEFVGGSAAENEVKMYVESLGLKTEKFKFSTLEGGKEIDIIVTIEDGTKIGIEYCGLYWHSEGSKAEKARGMHIAKLRKANAHDILLITVFEDEWICRQSQVKSFLKSKLHKNEKHLYARNLIVKMAEKAVAAEFLELYHIQGSGKIEVAYGLYDEEELVGVVTGSKHHRQNESQNLVLNRLCFKDGVSIAGGSSRLFKNLVGYAKNNGYSSVISWSDNRWSEGNVYKKLGFALEKELDVDYSYVYGNKRLSKQSCQKKELIKKGAIGDTEKEMATSIGLYRIWDCGKKRWVFKI